MTIGFNKDLYVLPFDHRATFRSKLFGWDEPITAGQTNHICAFKQVIYDGLKAAVAEGVPREKAGVLVDETFGAAILRDAKKNGYITAMTTEKSGQAEFDFEFGENFREHLEAFQPTFSKVLVRYNPEGDAAMNKRQAARLKRLSDYLHESGRVLFMFELLVPAEKAQMEQVKGNKKAYDLEIRPRLMVETIHQFQDIGVEADVWKIEGLDRQEDCAKVAAAARRDGRSNVGCIVLGRGEDDKKVGEWLATAAPVDAFIGFAVGRTVFWDPLVALRDKKAARESVVKEITRRYRGFVDVFEKARASSKREAA
jgi:5-dehydro-2-deoxygluconokinase